MKKTRNSLSGKFMLRFFLPWRKFKLFFITRLSQEGLQSIQKYIGPKRRVDILRDDLILVLQNDNPSNPPDISKFSEHTQNQIKDLGKKNNYLWLDKRCLPIFPFTIHICLLA